MKRETAENLVEALEIASVDCLLAKNLLEALELASDDCLLISQRDRLEYCISQVVIDLMADDGGDDA